MKPLFQIIILSVCFTFNCLAASPIFLFPEQPVRHLSSTQSPVEDYTKIISELKNGDELAFHDGARFEFQSFIGHGKTTNILKVRMLTGPHSGTVMALRIPLKGGLLYREQSWNLYYVPEGSSSLKLTFSLYIDEIIDHADAFFRVGIGPKLYQSLAGQYAAIELIDKRFTLDEYLRGKIVLSPNEENTVRNALLKFEQQATGVSSIKDIGEPGQVLFDGKRFILVDWYGVSYVSENIYPWAYYEWP